MGLRSAPAPFLTKTYDLVDDRSSDDVVSWNENGTTFVVWKTADFAKDMLPNFFKHNNFSSFVRQLNTYGFKKIVPDKWEFSNDNFKKGQKHLLIKIRRRKPVVTSPPAPAKTPFTISNSAGEDQGYTSSSSPDSKNSGSVEAPAGIEKVAAQLQFAGLSDENEKLKRDNEMLSSELAHVKKQCDELAVYLMDRVKVGPEQINRIMRQVSSCGSSSSEKEKKEEEAVAAGDGESSNNVKLFGVWVKSGGGGERKRGREEAPGTVVGGGPRNKKMSHVEFESPWMKISSCSGGVSRVCN